MVSCGASATVATVTLRFWLSVTKSLSGQSPELSLPLPVLVAAFATSCLPGEDVRLFEHPVNYDKARRLYFTTRPKLVGKALGNETPCPLPA